MALLDFFNHNTKFKSEKVKIEKPSSEQILFADTMLKIINPIVEYFGFVRHKTEIKNYSTNIVYRKCNQYIKISSTNYPTDYPYYYNIILGEGDSDNVFEYDWNSISIWAMAKIIDPTISIISYDFPFGNDLENSIIKANADLIKYADTFLKGDLTTFYQARKIINEKREPYKIHSLDKDGNYITIDEPKCVEQKEKYS